MFSETMFGHVGEKLAIAHATPSNSHEYLAVEGFERRRNAQAVTCAPTPRSMHPGLKAKGRWEYLMIYAVAPSGPISPNFLFPVKSCFNNLFARLYSEPRCNIGFRRGPMGANTLSIDVGGTGLKASVLDIPEK